MIDLGHLSDFSTPERAKFEALDKDLQAILDTVSELLDELEKKIGKPQASRNFYKEAYEHGRRNENEACAKICMEALPFSERYDYVEAILGRFINR